MDSRQVAEVFFPWAYVLSRSFRGVTSWLRLLLDDVEPRTLVATNGIRLQGATKELAAKMHVEGAVQAYLCVRPAAGLEPPPDLVHYMTVPL